LRKGAKWIIGFLLFLLLISSNSAIGFADSSLEEETGAYSSTSTFNSTSIGFVGGNMVKHYDLIRSYETEDSMVLSYIFTKPIVLDTPISPYLVPLSENDTFFQLTTSIAEHLYQQGFSVSYSNLAYNIGNSSFSARLSVIGPVSLFEEQFQTKLQYIEGVGYVNATDIILPDSLKTFVLSVEFAVEVEMFAWPQSWTPPKPNYYHLSPNQLAASDMGTTQWANSLQSIETAINAWSARQMYGYDGTGVNVAVIDSGFSRNHGSTKYYPTTTGFHPFYEEYYRDLLENRYVPHNNGAQSPDDDNIGHGTGIISNLLAVAPGITLHTIPLGSFPLPLPTDILPNAASALTVALSIEDLDVLSCSWGYPENLVNLAHFLFISMEDTINQLVANGVIVVFAAGNGHYAWPASMPNVVAVGGVYVDENGYFRASSYASSFDSSLYPGRHVPDFCGIVGQQPHGMLIEMPTQPGSDFDRLGSSEWGDQTLENDGWLVASGTSSAAPQVAGLAAIVKQIVPSAGVSTFKYYIESSAMDITLGTSHMGQSAGVGYDAATGYGLVDAENMILFIKSGKTMIPAYHNGWNGGAEEKVGLVTTEWVSYVDESEGTGYTYALAEAGVAGAGSATAWFRLGDYWKCPKTGKYEIAISWSYSGLAFVSEMLGALGIFSEIKANFGGIETEYTVFSRESWILGINAYLIGGSVTLKLTIDAVEGQTYYWYTTLKSWVVASAIGLSVAGGYILVNGRVHGVVITPIQEKMIISGLNWLRRAQSTDGSYGNLWGLAKTGITSLAVMGFINHGNSPYNPSVIKGLNFILSHRNHDGSFGDLKTYETSIAIMALTAARTAGYNPSTPNVDQYITDAMNWLLSNQNIETNVAISKSNKYYGGWGYYGADPSWADLSNTQFAMIALSLAESYLKVSPHVDNWHAAAIFVTRCNNNATNNPEFYFKNDGGFIYQPQSTIRTYSGDSYGSMTAAGVWVLGLARMAGVNQINMQVKIIDSIDPIYSGLKWLEEHYSVTQNPVNYFWGGDSFTYYYFWSVAKAWEITGRTTVAGHEWYAELISHLASVQSLDGHWPGTGSEEPDVLATEWAILSIELPIVPPHVVENSELKAILHSGADLHIYDQQGRHVGYNYATQQNEIQIPGATYTGREAEPQIITVPLTEGLKYTIEVVGTTGGPYELVVDVTTYDIVVAERIFTGTTGPGVVFPYSVEVVTIAGISLLVQPSISLMTTLEIGEPRYTKDTSVFVTSDTSFTLHVIDGSGIVSTTYRIFNATYDSGWIEYTAPFHLVGLADGIYTINYNSSDTSGNVEQIHTISINLDNSGPSITVENPPAGWALQDGVTFIASSEDFCGTRSLNFSIREANGDQGISVGFEDMPATYNETTGKWELFFDTLQLPDGFYVVLVSAEDNLGHMSTITVPYSIRNWAVLELLPASKNNKAGRTMPVKFALRVAASVDSNQPFVYNEELTIKIYAADDPDNILQTSTFGDTARDYRINTIDEHYITNFKTLKKPKTYIVEVWRKDMLIGSFQFETNK